MLAYLYYGNTHCVKLEDMQVEETSPVEYLDSDSVVTAVIYDSDGGAVTDGSVTLDYVAASNGDFLGYLDHDADIDIDSRYTIRVIATDSGKVARFDIPANCIPREGDNVL